LFGKFAYLERGGNAKKTETGDAMNRS